MSDELNLQSYLDRIAALEGSSEGWRFMGHLLDDLIFEKSDLTHEGMLSIRRWRFSAPPAGRPYWADAAMVSPQTA